MQKFTHVNLLDYIKEVERADFKNYYRMESETYQELLDLVTPYIEKKVRICVKQYQLMKGYYPAFRHPSKIGAPKIWGGFINIIRRTSCSLRILNFFSSFL
nr:unnamed protein product [Callosobruchus chinensis]